MALTPEQLAAMAETSIERTDGPTHLGSGEQHAAPVIDGENTTVISGDNPNGISQTF